MLFEKIRRTQKPVFIFLGLVFALSFVFLGVGSGAGGISLGNLLGQSSGSSGSTSINDLLGKVHSDPKDATAWRELGDAYQTSGQTTSALGAYAQYMNLRPKDANTITQVATLYETEAQKQAQRAAYWQSLASQFGTTTNPLPAGGEKLGTSIGAPLVSTAQQPLTQRAQTYQQQAQQSVLQAIALWKKAIALQPDNSTYERAIYRDALAVQDYKTAYQAVQRVLVLEPSAPDKKQLTTLLKQLKPLTSISTSGGTAGTP
ncbi:MAG TPA: hypothetical protein VGQ45_10975 [Gaiellales bacterium]|nr:hypothetical protein [Gaiellales bacterium]